MNPTPLKNEASFQEIVPRRKILISKTAISNCVFVKQYWQIMG